MVNHNLYDILRAGFPEDLSLIAIETPEANYTWRDIELLSARMAQLFQGLGLDSGARVMVQVEKSPEALFLYLATLRAGFVYVPLNTAYSETEMAYFIEDAQPSLVVGAETSMTWLEPLARLHRVPHVFSLEADGTGSLMLEAKKQHELLKTADRKPDDVAAILYTSGTTGRSKGALLTHGNLASNARTLHTFWGWRSDDVLLHMLPIFHIHGLFVASHGALLAGARMIWLPSLQVDQAIQYLPQSTVMMGVPTYYVRLLADSRFTQAVCTNMRLFISGSAPLLADTFNEFQQRTGMTILERYGLSETLMNTSNSYSDADHGRVAGTVGLPLPGVLVRVVDDNDQEVELATPGHVHVKGPNVFSGYWNMPEKTAQEFTADGWFRTGDIGVFGGDQIPNQYLSIVGRSKDLIISGGYNVYPKEVELLIDEMPGVLESAVIGVPHTDFGEAVVAVLVAKPDVELDLHDMAQRLKSHLANYKLPKKMVVIPSLPRNTMAKVQKNILRDDYRQLFSTDVFDS